MDEHIFDKVQEVDMQKTMENYYIDYAMSVIASRALPDVRDGLIDIHTDEVHFRIELGKFHGIFTMASLQIVLSVFIGAEL